MGYKVLDICRHIINYSNEKDYGISNLKLQKVLYFVQAYFLIQRKITLLVLMKRLKHGTLVLWCPKHTENISSMEAGIYLQ